MFKQSYNFWFEISTWCSSFWGLGAYFIFVSLPSISICAHRLHCSLSHCSLSSHTVQLSAQPGPFSCVSLSLSQYIYRSLALHFSSLSLSIQQPLHLARYISATLGSNFLLLGSSEERAWASLIQYLSLFSVLIFDCFLLSLFSPAFSFCVWSLISQSFHLLGICFWLHILSLLNLNYQF